MHSPAVIYSLRIEGQKIIPLLITGNVTPWLGFSVEEALHPDWWTAHVHPEDLPVARSGFASLFEGGVSDVNYRLRHKDGSFRWVKDTKRLVAGAPGPHVEIAGVWDDITEQTEAQRRTAAFSALGRNLHSAQTPKEAAQIILAAADELIGWDACTLDLYDETAGTVEDVINIDTLDGQRREVTSACPNGPPSLMFARTIREGAQLILRKESPGGSTELRPFGDTARRSASLLFAPIRHGAKPVGVFSIQSYTRAAYDREDLETLQALADHCGGALERIQALTTLAEEQQLLRTVIDNLPDSIYVKDTAGRFLLANAANLRLLGARSTEDVRGKTVFDFFPPEMAQRFSDDDQEVVRSGKPLLDREELFLNRSGQKGWHLTTKVDDEPGIRELNQQILTQHGYQVLVAEDGSEAVVLMAQRLHSIQLVLTDLMMPIMDGLSLIRALKMMNPDIRVIATSGLGEDTRLSELSALNVKSFLNKPYSADELLTAVHEILRSSRTPAERPISDRA